MALCDPKKEAGTGSLAGISQEAFQETLNDPATQYFLLGLDPDYPFRLVCAELPAARV